MASYLASFPTAVRELCQCTTSLWDSSGLPGCLATPRNGQYCPVWTESPDYSRFLKKKDTSSPQWWERERDSQPVYKWIFTASSKKAKKMHIQPSQKCLRWVGAAAKSSTEHKNLVPGDYQQVLGELLVCVLVCICVSLCQYKEECFPMVPWSSTGQQKSLIQKHPGGLLLERESFAGFANWSPPKLNKQKTSTASSLFLQHGLLHYEIRQSQRSGWHRADHSDKWGGGDDDDMETPQYTWASLSDFPLDLLISDQFMVTLSFQAVCVSSY